MVDSCYFCCTGNVKVYKKLTAPVTISRMQMEYVMHFMAFAF